MGDTSVRSENICTNKKAILPMQKKTTEYLEENTNNLGRIVSKMLNTNTKPNR